MMKRPRPPRPDVRGDDGRGDHLQGGQAHPAHDQRDGARQLHPRQDLALAHAHAAGGVDRGPVGAGDAGVGAGEQRRDGQQDQREGRRQQPEPEEQHEQDEHPELGQRPQAVGRAHDRETTAAGVPDHGAHRDRDHDRDRDGQRGVAEVLDHPGRDAGRAAPVRRVDQPREASGRAPSTPPSGRGSRAPARGPAAATARRRRTRAPGRRRSPP